jgi:hypothetical protein
MTRIIQKPTGAKLNLAKTFTWNETVWNPSMITTALWLDAADAGTVTTVSGAVSQWNDKSGNSRNFAQSTIAARPAFTASGLNSKTVMSFDGGDSLTASFSLAVTSESVFVVLKYASASSSFARIFSQSDSGSDFDNTGHYIPLLRSGTAASLASYATGSSRSPISLAYDTWGIVSSIHTGSQITNYINAAAGDNFSHTLDKTFTRFALGAQAANTPGGFLNGSIAEVVLLPAAATETQRQKLEGYLAHKWGLTANLPSDHPYKTTGPTP